MPVFNPRRRPDTSGGQSATALYRISQAIGHLLRSRGTERQLSPAQIQALLFLRYARPGVRTIGGLASRLTSSYATTSEVVNALEKKKLVERHPLPEDQRTITLRLTGKGESEASTLENILDEIEVAVDELSLEDQQAFVRATQSIVRRLQAAGHIQVYEMCWGCQFFRQNAHPDDRGGPHHCAFMDAPLPEANTYLECPDFVPLTNL
jgi:DNA-binding MarR family transcriptional regulator